ncbi:MAG: PilZ domain-containing protein [Candidatus Eremiobacteraeota bacterium]|nr:PilZ domain-containing protein [Candidatus Eremiobacteraeota bacterium]
MPWIGNAQQQSRRNERAAPVASLEHATKISGRGIAPANAVIEHLTAHECRLRTVVFFDNGEHVEFDFVGTDNVCIRARGRVAARVSKGPRFIYKLRLDRMEGHETDALARQIAQLHRKQTTERWHRRSLDALPTTDALARSSPRVPAGFALQYRTARENPKPGRACDVSYGGLSMTCRDALIPGEMLELRFVCPSDVLDVYPHETAVLDLRTRSVSHVRADMRRPFEEMQLRARVVSHQPLGDGTFQYGLAFLDLDSCSRQELTRYVDAVETAKRRRGR